MSIPIEFYYAEGSISHTLPGHDTGWRVMPYAVFTHTLHSFMYIDTADAPTIKAAHGQAALIPSGIQHRFQVMGPELQVSTWCHLQFTLCGTIDILNLFDLPILWEGKEANRLRRITQELHLLHQEYDETTLTNSLSRQASIQAAGMQFLATVLKSDRTHIEVPELAEQLAALQPVLNYMREHLDTALTLPKLASVVHMSRSRFSDLFTKVVRVPPMKHLAHLRIERAQMLLMHTADPVADIGRACGYPDPFHFSRTFKAATSLGPRAFRKLHKERADQGPSM